MTWWEISVTQPLPPAPSIQLSAPDSLGYNIPEIPDAKGLISDFQGLRRWFLSYFLTSSGSQIQ